MTKITLGESIINELMQLNEGECEDVYDDNGTLGYLERDEKGEISIRGKKFNFNYYAPDYVKVYVWLDGSCENKKPIEK